MEISNQKNIISQSVHTSNNTSVNGRTASFKGRFADKCLYKSGSAMNWIENQGFLALFLIQDFLGMTLPRTFAGFLRDKEVTGEYNVQEGFEVLGREGLTGPSMMAVAPLTLWLTSKYCGQSVSVNSELIKRFGNSFKELVSSPEFNKELLSEPLKFKNEFYTKNLEIMLKHTLGDDKKPFDKNKIDETVKYIINELNNYENIPKDVNTRKFRSKSKYRAERMNNIIARINDLKYNSASDLEMLRKIKFGSEVTKDFKVFDTKSALEGMVKYSNDAVKFTKNLSKLDGAVAESLKHNALGKRVLVNIGMIAATLGMLSVLPKLYLRSDTAPGSRKKFQNIETNSAENIAFKGKGNGIVEKLGKMAEKNKKDFVSSELEYNGHNFTNTLMAGLSIFGLITPRCMRAYQRADKDEKTGKKDLTELWEIIIRDITSSLAVVFAVPMMTRMFVTSYEKNSGFVLMQKDRTMSGAKVVLDLLNPYSKAHVLSNSEIDALYDNINTKEKMLNFCKYIDKNGGDLQKIISKSAMKNEIFNEKTFKFDKSLSKKDANQKIINFVENLEENAKKLGKSTDKKSLNTLIENLMKGTKKSNLNMITGKARGLNSLPGLLTTVFISPYILGWVIPRLTYKNTRRIHAKEDRERENNLKLAV